MYSSYPWPPVNQKYEMPCDIATKDMSNEVENSSVTSIKIKHNIIYLYTFIDPHFH